MDRIILDDQKLVWHKDRVNAWGKGERIPPITIDCALTRRCTYRCVYCYGMLQENDERRMTRDVIFRFLDDASEIGVKAISLISDGESTCSPHLHDAVMHGCENGLDMALGTNGYMLKNEELPDILRALTYLRFNITAATVERYSQIHGCAEKCYYKVIDVIKKCVNIKKENGLNVTIGLQMVLLPDFQDQVIPLSKLGRSLGVDYLVIKHCSDDESGALGVDYSRYHDMIDLLKKAESFSDDDYLVKVKWSKILGYGKSSYSRCYGPQFIMQLSGSGLVAPCGMLFNNKYKKYHIGNIADTSFKELFNSDRYWEVMKLISSDKFDARTMCGSLCLQHKVNEVLDNIKKGKCELEDSPTSPPMHVNFI